MPWWFPSWLTLRLLAGLMVRLTEPRSQRLTRRITARLTMQLLAGLLLCPWPALAHQTGNSYLQIENTADVLTVQIAFPIRDLGSLLQDASVGTAPSREQLAQQQAPLANVIAASLLIEVDGRALPLRFEAQQVALRNDGLYVSQRHVAPALPPTAATIVVRYGFFNDSERIARAFVQLKSGGQERSYVLDPRHAVQRLPLRDESLAESLWTYAREGTLHIWSGPDHLLFLFCLLLPGLSLVATGARAPALHALKVVTAFTAAHSITLAAAALDWIVLPEKPVEVAIAASIVIAAALALRGGAARHQWQLAFGFGLVHGLGFANGLRELGLSTDHVLGSLLAFNVGVEFGQMVVVLAAALLLWPFYGSALARARIQRWGAVANLALASVWLVERLG